MRASAALAALLPAAATARVVMEDGAGTAAAGSWRLGDRAAAEEELTVYLMMRHEPADVKLLEETLLAVSDPRSPKYGQHLSLDELAALTPISAAKKAAVARLLSGDGVRSVTENHNGDIVEARLTAAAAERIFATRLHRFHHTQRAATTLLRAGPYSLPEDAAAAVSAVADLVSLPHIHQARRVQGPTEAGWKNSCTLSGCAGKVTPEVLHERYSVPNDTTGMDAGENNSMAVAEFQGQYFDTSDLKKFSSGCHANVTVDHLIGKNTDDPISAGVEALLDIEYIRGVAPGIPLTVDYTSDFSLAAWMSKLSSRKHVPLVHSVSYGNDERQQSSTAYMFSCNTQFMKAGARGLSILFASGDQGVCGRSTCIGLSGKHFHPDFPAASPYITAIGGTDFATKGVIGEEKVWTAGGGGFSDTFDIPAWQADAVAAYKADPAADLPPQKMWNNTGRGYPDLAALGGEVNPYCVVSDGAAEGVAGTSASSPVAAAVFARLNGIRIAAGKAPLGWLNPFIYQNGDAFNDVTQGKNSGSLLNQNGFTAIKGWDPASGWGTPNFAALAKRV